MPGAVTGVPAAYGEFQRHFSPGANVVAGQVLEVIMIVRCTTTIRELGNAKLITRRSWRINSTFKGQAARW